MIALIVLILWTAASLMQPHKLIFKGISRSSLISHTQRSVPGGSSAHQPRKS